ncbi:methylamine utilization protein [Phenylobacterium montanum]|uniref:Methylamine utilization protein n=1 Tax=Phenylobacterium montanum TaxID=2823693 RepID=A0A975FYH6_9CAUL|nr:methylamine utilization protein [Caulobacter sp. S6]QUD87188.1 methylamine utilization protein [Caulobacter sp. S6]
MRALFALAAWLLAAGAASAADLTVQVKTTAGAPVADAVVTVYPQAGAAPLSANHFDWPMRVSQQNIQFHPFVLIAPVGATVAFPNLDKVRHHVYSFSATHPFELKLYGSDQERSVRFDKAGVIALGCNIHDQMVAFVKVVDTPYAAKTDASGMVTLHDLPAGAATLKLWRPYLHAPGNEVSRTVSVGHGTEAFAIDVRQPPAMHNMY